MTTPRLTNVINFRSNRGVSRASAALAITFVSAGVVLSGCGGSASSTGRAATPVAATSASPGAGGVQQVRIDTTDSFRFAPADVTAHPGKLQITLTDSGSYPHNISFAALHTTSKTVSGSPGEQSTTFTIDVKPGTYSFVCTFHSSAGMKGTLVVK